MCGICILVPLCIRGLDEMVNQQLLEIWLYIFNVPGELKGLME